MFARWLASPRGRGYVYIDLFEWEGNTYLFYATGDQQTWGSLREALFLGPMKKFFEMCFPPGAHLVEASAKTK